MRVMFRRRQQERKVDVFFSTKKAQDVCRAVVDCTEKEMVGKQRRYPVVRDLIFQDTLFQH